MATESLNQTTDTAITLDLSSLATSSSFFGGRESNQIDNTSTLYEDVMVYVDAITGHASTAPTIGQQIRVYVWGSTRSLASTAIDTLVGTDGARTLAHGSILQSLRFVDAPTVTVATAALKYYVQPFSVAARFDDVMPAFWGIFVTHNHNGALAASQSTLFSYRGIKHDIV